MSVAGESVEPVTATSAESRGRAHFTLAVLTLAYVVSFIDRQAISLLAVPIQRDLQLTDMQLGLLQGLAFATIYVFAGLPLGRAADQYNRRNIIMAGVAMWSVMTASCGLARNYWTLLACRAGVGIGEATLSPAAYSLLADRYPPRQLPAAMSAYNLGPSIGSGLAFLLGGAILAAAGDARILELGLPGLREVYPWQVVFLLLGALGIVVVALLAWVPEPVREVAGVAGKADVSVGDTVRFLQLHASTVLALMAGLALLAVVSYATMTWYATMIVRTYGESVSRVGMTLGPVMIAGSVAGNVLGAWLAMRLADRGWRAPYVAGVLLVSIGVTAANGIAPLMPTAPLTYAMSGLVCVLNSMWMGPAMAALHLAVPNRMRAQATAVTLLGTNLVGLGLGPAAVAAITQYGFEDPAKLRYSIAIVTAVAGSLAIVLIGAGWRNFARRRDD
jgi:MFS family permease